MEQRLEIIIDPVPKPRQTRSDKWKKRPCVMRYRAFADKLRASGVRLPEYGCHMIFVIPMPKSWSVKKKQAMNGQPHQQRPDVDNIFKAVADALLKEDCRVWDGRVTKIWGEVGKIIFKT